MNRTGQPYDQQYCWMVRWSAAGKIVQVRAYIDGLIVNTGLKEDEKLLREGKIQ